MILYKDIFNFDIILMKTILKEYGGNENAWKLFRHFYKDPDSYAITNKGCKSIQGIECTVDGLLSINRIREHENFGNKFVDTFAIYRKIPIIFFPRERGGINQRRFSVFGDRIDHTLFDLKQYCEGKYCMLKNTYELPKTNTWIRSFDNSFEEIVKWLKIDNIFVNEDNEIYDLEKNDETIISNYSKGYNKKWSEQYYINLKKKILKFTEKNNIKL